MTDRSDAVDLAAAGDGYLASASALGDRQAFETLMRRHGPSLHAYARRMLDDQDDVADVVQDTFIAAWRQLDAFRGGSEIRTWLISICARKVVDTYRVKRAQPIDDQLLEAVPDTDSARDPLVSMSSSAFFGALERALTELPPRQRASWVLREIDEMSFPQIAQILGVSPDGARGHHFRATAALRLRLERWR